MPKRGDVVLYSQTGRTYNAIVLAAHTETTSHLGANGEPTLHLAILFDDPPGRASLQPGFLSEMTVVHDVVHFSHKFSDDYKKQYGLGYLSNRGAGEWREVQSAPKPLVVKGAK